MAARIATHASATSTTLNCGCQQEWQETGCVIGNGVYTNESFACTNYWKPVSATPKPECLNATATMDCLQIEDTKIIMDEEFIAKQFGDFLNVSAKPFLASVWYHGIHVPRAALPEYYDLYPGDRDADYLGSISQLDAGIGMLVATLKKQGVYDNTLLWFMSDKFVLDRLRP